MIASQRRLFILNRLRTQGAVRITDLSEDMGVSTMTVRRDINDLADQGMLRRVHGGAVSTSSLLAEPLFSVKSRQATGLKDAIAREALQFVHPGDVIAIGGGTTTYVFAQRLLRSPKVEGLTILTNSTPVAELVQASEAHGAEVIVTGGVVTRSNALVGPIADKVIGSLRVNSVFLGTHSVSLPRGFLTPNSLEASTNSALISISDKAYILADHTKWQNTSLSLFASLGRVDAVISDDGLPDDTAERTRAGVRRLLLADTSMISVLPAKAPSDDKPAKSTAGGRTKTGHKAKTAGKTGNKTRARAGVKNGTRSRRKTSAKAGTGAKGRTVGRRKATGRSTTARKSTGENTTMNAPKGAADTTTAD